MKKNIQYIEKYQDQNYGNLIGPLVNQMFLTKQLLIGQMNREA
jgi:hypothetical protein